MSDDYEVGYGKPPKHTQYKPGQSGNPDGRPKGSKNKRTERYMDKLADLFIRMSEREVRIKENGKVVSMPMAQVMLRAVESSAMKTAKSQELYFDLLTRAYSHVETRKFDLLEAVINYKENWRKVFKQYDEVGEPRPNPVPHPDHIKIDVETGEVTLIGPATYDQRLREETHQLNRKFLAETGAKFAQDILKDDESYLKWIDECLVAHKQGFEIYEQELARDDLEDHIRDAIKSDMAAENERVELLKERRRELKRMMKKNSTSEKS